jgi:hypothetical protein
MSEADVKAAYRTINEAEPETVEAVKRLRGLYKKAGEDTEHGDLVIAEILEGGPGAAARLNATADAVAQLWGIQE